MIKTLVLIFWVLFIGLIFQNKSLETEPKRVCDDYEIRRSNRIFAIVLFSIPLIFCGFRYAFADTWGYMNTFNKTPSDMGMFNNFMDKTQEAKLFAGLRMIFKCYISADPQMYFLTISLIQMILLVSTLRKYSENLGLSAYLFVASGMFFSWMCNGMRQFLAVTILFSLTDWIIKNKWLKYILVLLLLSGIASFSKYFGVPEPIWFLDGIHESAIILIPIFFIVQGKALNKKVWITLFILLFLVLFGLLDSFLETFASNTSYAVDIENAKADTGASPLRFLVSLVPVLLVLIKRKEAISDDTPKLINICINMSFISSTLYLGSTFTSGTYVGRLPIYCEVYNLILIPYLINNFYKEKDRKILLIALYVLYLIYYLYQTLIVYNTPKEYLIKLFGFVW